jgi:hypothetical protein
LTPLHIKMSRKALHNVSFCTAREPRLSYRDLIRIVRSTRVSLTPHGSKAAGSLPAIYSIASVRFDPAYCGLLHQASGSELLLRRVKRKAQTKLLQRLKCTRNEHSTVFESNDET